MQPCSQITSCVLVDAMKPNFPKALEFLKQKYCHGEKQRCALFRKGELDPEESLIYQTSA